MNIIEREPWIQSFLQETDAVIHEVFENTGSAEFKDILKTHHQGGKRLRPMVIAASAQLGDRPALHLAYGAAALELLHLASLFHDDVLDDTTMRRDKLTARKHIGNLNSILTGDYLLAEVLHTIVEKLPTPLVSAFLDTIKRMTRSEILSKKLLNNLQISTSEYVQIIENKTATVFALATSLGIRLSTDDPVRIRQLSIYGMNLGMAYQIIDDMEDMTGASELTDDDLSHGYIGMPVIELLRAVPLNQKQEVLQMVRATQPEQRAALIRMMKSFSIFKVVHARVQHYLNISANALLDIKANTPEQRISLEFLKGLCGYLADKSLKAVDTYESADHTGTQTVSASTTVAATA